ncbi:lantibiotic dehydratase C-terminal domain-containing protein [Kitasatospora sp. NPDC002543]
MNEGLTEADWWYVRLYPGGLEHLDEAVTSCLPPLVETALAGGSDRWFFIQYTDWNGPHLRLRIHGPRHLLDSLHRRLPALAIDCERLAGRAPTERPLLLPLDLRPFVGRHAGADVAVYEPEDGKYGGPTGTRLAEEVFQHSSELALWGVGLARTPDRAALAVLLLRGSVAALQRVSPPEGVRPISESQFWHRHFMWWTQDVGHAAEQLRTRLRDDAEQDRWGIEDRAESLASDPVVRHRIEEWTSVVAAYLDRASHHAVPHSAAHLVFHQAHMMLNRIGILPREEALLGVLAARAEFVRDLPV